MRGPIRSASSRRRSRPGPVYKLLGKKDLGVSELPALDKPVIDGDLGWHYHTGGHAATAADWKAFLDFLGKYLQVGCR